MHLKRHYLKSRMHVVRDKEMMTAVEGEGGFGGGQ